MIRSNCERRYSFPFAIRSRCAACSFCFRCMQYESNPFYLSSKWKRKRKSILIRDKYQCQDCKRYGRMREATEVHHIKHLDEFPELAYDNNNLISLCHACHNARHPEKGRTARKKYEKVSGRGAGTRKIAKNFD